jgi:putative ubiquitin-RnfH superfamily antitoxin RatB of RatAB toxin-antitoxin module
MARLSVEVVYALPGGEDAVRLELAPGATALDAVRASGLLERHPEIDLARQRIGIYGRVVEPQALLRDADRVELYRPLMVEPKEARRRRAVTKR